MPGAVSLYRAGREKLAPHLPAYMEIRVDLLLGQMDSLFGPLDRSSPPPESIDPDRWPRPTWLHEHPE